MLVVRTVGEDAYRYLGVLLRQQAETGKLDLSFFTRQVQGKLMDAVAVIAAKRQLWFEAHIYSHAVVVGKVAYAALASMLPLEPLWRADRLQATHVKHVLSAPQGQSRHQMHVAREALGLQLPCLVAEAGLIPWSRELFTFLFEEGDLGRIARAV